MRVAMVSEHASPLAALGGVDAGGQNVFVAGLAGALVARGARVTVHTRRDDPELPEQVPVGCGMDVHHVDAGPARPVGKDDLFPYMDEFARRLEADWSRSRPDVVHAHFWMSGYAALAAARRLGIPVLQTFHALGVVKRRHQGARDTSPHRRVEVEAAIAAAADGILATSSDELFELVRMGADGRRVTVIPGGVDLDLFHPDGPAAPPRADRMRIVVVSRLVERKGIGNVITALTDLPGCELVVAGGSPGVAVDEDPQVARYRDLAAREGVADRVRFLGSLGRSGVPALIRSASVVACTPWYEPFGIVAVEAMACGVPVVATAVGGLVDTVVDGETGLHVPPRAPERIASAIRTLQTRPAARVAMGEAGVRRVRSHYGWDRIAELTMAAYRRAAGAAEPDVARRRA